MEFTFHGMNNVSDPAKIGKRYDSARGKTYGESPALINVDADDKGGVYSRPLNPYTGIAAEPMNCFYNGRNYWAEGNEILFGSTIEGTGARDLGGVLTEFEVPVTMLVNMPDGMFIGTQNEVVFISGGDPMLGDMTFRQVHTFGVAPNTCCKVQNVDLGIDATGYSIVFLSHNGICIGAPDGQVQNVTTNIVAIPACASASATLRTIRNMTHYVVKIGGEISTPDQFVPIVPDDIR